MNGSPNRTTTVDGSGFSTDWIPVNIGALSDGGTFLPPMFPVRDRYSMLHLASVESTALPLTGGRLANLSCGRRWKVKVCASGVSQRSTRFAPISRSLYLTL